MRSMAKWREGKGMQSPASAEQALQALRVQLPAQRWQEAENQREKNPAAR
jgi:hypothetical protein